MTPQREEALELVVSAPGPFPFQSPQTTGTGHWTNTQPLIGVP